QAGASTRTQVRVVPDRRVPPSFASSAPVGGSVYAGFQIARNGAPTGRGRLLGLAVSVRLAVPLPVPARHVERRVEDEHLEEDVGLNVSLAHERNDLRTGELLDLLAVALTHHLLELAARSQHALGPAALDH